MSKKCPECGEDVPNQAHFCGNCGYDFFQSDSSSSVLPANAGGIFSNGKMLLGLVAVVIIVAAIVVMSMGFGGNGNGADEEPAHEVDLTITEVNGYTGGSSYTLYTEAIFNKVPSNQKGYNVKTTYYDKNNTEIGYEIETLSDVYYDTDFSISFGYYTTYKKPNPDYVKVEIIKEGKVIDAFNSTIDQGKIEFLN